jgi:hypothetical protein
MPTTPTLRLTQSSIAPGQHQLQLTLDGAGRPQAATARFAFQLSDRTATTCAGTWRTTWNTPSTQPR